MAPISKIKNDEVREMLKAAIIADDLTGANDTGAIIAQEGYRVGTVLDLKDIDKFQGYDILCTSTGSRGMEKSKAFEVVKEASECFKSRECNFFSKRCDSTLRGNVGAEIDAVLKGLGEDTYAIVVASFPNSGRTALGDYLLVNHVPLELTEVAKDPISPVSISNVTDIVRLQTEHKVGYVALTTVMQGNEAIKKAVLEQTKDCRVVVIDARTNEDIQEIAKGCVGAGIKFVAIDPGPFTGSVVRELYAGEKKEKKILCSIGSASALTRRQIQALEKHCNPYIVKVNSLSFFKESEREAEVQRIVKEVVNNKEQSDILAVVTTFEDSDVLDFSKIEEVKGKSKGECAEYIAGAMADITYEIQKQLKDEIGGLYVSGGDISSAYSKRIGAVGFDVRAEVVPLAIYSMIIDKDMNKTPIVTKGGLVGSDDTLITCIDYLKSVI